MLRREGHPLGVRRAEATKAATEEHEDFLSRKRWTLGVATGALLVAGTFAAGALGLHGAPTNTAGSAPEHAPAAPGHNPGDGGPVVGAPVPGQGKQQQPQNQATPDPRKSQPTTPASAGGPQTGTPAAPSGDTGSTQSGSGDQRSQGDTSTPAPAPTTEQPAPQQPAPPAQDSSSGGGLLGTVGGILSPVTDAVGGILSPNSAQSDSSATTSTTKAAPSGPALTMINPLGDLLATG